MAKYYVRFDDPRVEDARSWGKGPGTGLPVFSNRKDAEICVRRLNQELNKKFGTPKEPPFPVYFVESSIHLWDGKDEE